MARTAKHLFDQIASFDALEAAYRRARRGKRDRAEVQRFERDLEGELIQLQNELLWGTYRLSPYRLFRVFEPKERLIAALPFRDRVVQHALVAVIEPLWERRFIAHSYACRPGRGLHRAVATTQGWLRHLSRDGQRVYALKGDIAQYFPSIDHGLLKALLRRRIACPRTLALCDLIIDASPSVSGLAAQGLPIGNLTSQLWANVYLDALDRFVKHEVRARYYARYMDDFILLATDKDTLHRARGQIETFLWEQLRLRTNRKTQVFPLGRVHGRGLAFVGFRLWPSHRLLTRASVVRIRRNLKRLADYYRQGLVSLTRVQQGITSWIAHAQHAQTWGLRQKLLGELPVIREARHGAG